MNNDKKNNSLRYEKIKYHMTAFPINMHVDKIGQNYQPLPTHFHGEIELHLILGGEGNAILNGVTHMIKQGDLVFIAPFTLHRIENTGAYLHSCCFLIDPHFFSDFLFGDMNKILFSITNSPVLIKKMHFVMDEMTNKKELYQLVVKGELTSVFAQLLRNNSNISFDYSKNDKNFIAVKKALDYIHNNYTEKISVDQLCKVVNLSNSYFSQCFLKATGKTVTDYIIHLRCQHAFLLLRNNKTYVKDACFLSGFNNLSYFTKKFKEQYGFLPSETSKKSYELNHH